MRTATAHFRRPREGFTLVEILTALAITTVIVVALVSMFNTSTKALLAANRMTDIWEDSRAAFGLLRSDISQATVGGRTNRVNLYAGGGVVASMTNQFVGSIDTRLQEIYILSNDGGPWGATVYRVVRETANAGVGTLYRFQTNYASHSVASGDVLPIDVPVNNLSHPLRAAYDSSLDASLNQFKKLADGVVNLRLVAFATDGRAYTNTATLSPAPTDHEVYPDYMTFWGQALPAFVDLELFVLEPDRIEEFRAQAGDIAKRNYLERHVGNIQIFRTRIPIRRDAYASK